MTNKGFTLLEILVSVAILAISLLVIMDFHSGSMLASRRAEDVTTATQLARFKLQELQLEIEKGIMGGEFPEGKEEEGKFEEPFEDYRWVASVTKVEIPVPPPSGEEGGMDMMIKFFEVISKQIAEAVREIRLEVFWDELGEEQSLSLTTHVVKM